MATSTFVCAPTNATDAQFRAWGGGLSTAFTAVGFTKTSDTGQVDWTTVLAPTAGSTFTGYEIRQFSDGATPACVVKIEYGSASTGTSVATIPTVRITVGTGSNGSGTITGVTASTSSTTFSAGSSTFSCFVSGDGSYVAFSMWPQYTTNNNIMTFVLDRTRNADGTANTDGLFFMFPLAATTGAIATYNRAGGAWSSAIAPPAFMPQIAISTGVQGADVYLSGYYPPIVGKVESPSVAAVCYWRGDFTLGSPFTANPGNGSKTWMPVLGCGWDIRQVSGGNQSLAIRWD